MGRPPCCDKSNVKRGLWTAEEDMKILAYVSTHGVGNWTSVPKKAGLKRCGKSCRLRWTNYLRPDLKHDSFTPEEEELIIHLHATIGSRWSIIAGQLPGRTDNDVKNFWNTKLKKKLCEMGIDPVTHKPIAQIIADYGSIGLPKLGMSKSYTSRHHQAGTTRISCLNRDLKKAFQYKSHTNPPQKNVDSITLMSNSSSQPWELLAQLQAMQLVAEASGSCYNGQDPVQPCLFTGSSSSSASSSCFGTNQQGSILQEITQVPSLQHCSQAFYPQMEASSSSSPPSSFSWSEFLSDDAFLLPIQEDVSMFLSATDSSSAITITDQSTNNAAGLNHAEVQQQGLMGVGHGEMSAESSSACAEASSKSFVDEILDHESEMPWDFTDILMQENQDP